MTSVPAFDRFVADMRALCAERLPEEAHWRRAAELLKPLLADPAMKAAAQGWPPTETETGGPVNLVLHRDADFGFVLNVLVKKPGKRTAVHDHGRIWTLYGVLSGGEEVERYERTDDGPPVPRHARVRRVARDTVGPGYVDVVPPWHIHAETNGPDNTIALILRGELQGEAEQNIFDVETGAVRQFHGPEQVPFKLP